MAALGDVPDSTPAPRRTCAGLQDPSVVLDSTPAQRTSSSRQPERDNTARPGPGKIKFKIFSLKPYEGVTMLPLLKKEKEIHFSSVVPDSTPAQR